MRFIGDCLSLVLLCRQALLQFNTYPLSATN